MFIILYNQIKIIKKLYINKDPPISLIKYHLKYKVRKVWRLKLAKEILSKSIFVSMIGKLIPSVFSTKKIVSYKL